MKQIVRQHIGGKGEEIWELKLKDKPDQSGFRIENKQGHKIKAVELIKVPKKNNHIIIKIIT